MFLGVVDISVDPRYIEPSTMVRDNDVLRNRLCQSDTQPDNQHMNNNHDDRDNSEIHHLLPYDNMIDP